MRLSGRRARVCTALDRSSSQVNCSGHVARYEFGKRKLYPQNYLKITFWLTQGVHATPWHLDHPSALQSTALPASQAGSGPVSYVALFTSANTAAGPPAGAHGRRAPNPCFWCQHFPVMKCCSARRSAGWHTPDFIAHGVDAKTQSLRYVLVQMHGRDAASERAVGASRCSRQQQVTSAVLQQSTCIPAWDVAQLWSSSPRQQLVQAYCRETSSVLRRMIYRCHRAGVSYDHREPMQAKSTRERRAPGYWQCTAELATIVHGLPKTRAELSLPCINKPYAGHVGRRIQTLLVCTRHMRGVSHHQTYFGTVNKIWSIAGKARSLYCSRQSSAAHPANSKLISIDRITHASAFLCRGLGRGYQPCWLAAAHCASWSHTSAHLPGYPLAARWLGLWHRVPMRPQPRSNVRVRQCMTKSLQWESPEVPPSPSGLSMRCSARWC